MSAWPRRYTLLPLPAHTEFVGPVPPTDEVHSGTAQPWFTWRGRPGAGVRDRRSSGCRRRRSGSRPRYAHPRGVAKGLRAATATSARTARHGAPVLATFLAHPAAPGRSQQTVLRRAPCIPCEDGVFGEQSLVAKPRSSNWPGTVSEWSGLSVRLEVAPGWTVNRTRSTGTTSASPAAIAAANSSPRAGPCPPMGSAHRPVMPRSGGIPSAGGSSELPSGAARLRSRTASPHDRVDDGGDGALIGPRRRPARRGRC